ncbi:hypothetical protein SpCBS45565_g05965 [Spizellomyces sp. 'palustris']|nr:hypothetical protein SpCBS45565_g05965 [Spizellomyces sp. 'palustris']
MGSVWVVSAIFRSKEHYENEPDIWVYTTEQAIQAGMERIARRLYNKAHIIQETKITYFDQKEDIIDFGEYSDSGMGFSYRNEWARVYYQEVKVEKDCHEAPVESSQDGEITENHPIR